MNIAQRHATHLLLAMALAAVMTAATAQPQASPPARVSVTYANPQQFTENRGARHRRNDDTYLKTLKAYLVEQAMRYLEPGQHLDVTITDIDLAGGYEPWHGVQWDDVRFMRNVYPPRIDLRFKLLDGPGKVLRQGTRELHDLGYLQGNTGMVGETDPLRYDKALLDRWLRRGPAGW